MKILHLLSSMDPKAGGPPIAMLGLGKALIDQNIDLSLLTSYTHTLDHNYINQLMEYGAKISTIGPAKPPLSTHPDLKEAVFRHVQEADLVHIHGLWEQIQHLGACAAKHHNKPYIIRPCGMLDPWSLSQSRLKKKLYMQFRLRSHLNHAMAIHFTTTMEHDLTKPLQLKSPGIVEPNGLDMNEYNQLPKPNSFRKLFPETGEKRIILFLSRIHYKKGPDLLIRGFHQANLENTCLVFAGPGDQSYIETLNRLAQNLGIQNKVLFIGPVYGEQKLAAFQDAGLFALTSHQENFGNVVLESIACGTPVLISDQVNLYPDLKPHRLCMCCQTNPNSISSQLKAWHAGDEIAGRTQEHGSQFVQSNYSWKSISSRWIEHYKALIKK